MAGIDLGTKSGSRKSVDAVLPLVPFIDLFLCCIMFLLVTAVWNELASVEARQRGPGDGADRLETTDIQLVVSLTADGFVVATTGTTSRGSTASSTSKRWPSGSTGIAAPIPTSAASPSCPTTGSRSSRSSRRWMR
jgi:hypothetical protein